MSNKEKIAIGILVIAVIIIIVLYKGKNKVEDTVLFHYSTIKGIEYAENKDYIFYLNNPSSDSTLVYENKKTGNVEECVKNPLKKSYIIGQRFFVSGKFLYYSYLTKDYSARGMHDAYGKFQIIEVDTTNFNERKIYEVYANIGEESLGIAEANYKDFLFYTMINGFFLDDTYLYFITSNEIWSVHRITGEKSKLIENKVLKCFGYDGNNIFYVNDYLQIVKYNTKTMEQEELPDILTDFFMLTDRMLFFLNRRDKNKVYVYDFETKEIEKINDKEALWFVCNEDYVFYRDKNSESLYRMDVNGQNDIVVYNEAVIDIYLFTDYDKMFLFTQENNNFVIINKNTLGVY